jgi:hypothetical protein
MVRAGVVLFEDRMMNDSCGHLLAARLNTREERFIRLVIGKAHDCSNNPSALQINK